jgi:hypothetical protein
VGEKSKRAERVEDAAASVAKDLVEIREILQGVSDNAGWRLRKGEQDELRTAIKRLDTCRLIITTELDQPNPNQRFLRLCISAGVLAGNLGVGFAGSELSARYDLQWPAHEAHAAVARAEESERALDDELGWELLPIGEGWWAGLADRRQGVQVDLDFDGPGDTLARIRFPASEYPTVTVVDRRGEWERTDDWWAMAQDAIRFLALIAPEEEAQEIRDLRVGDDPATTKVTVGYI